MNIIENLTPVNHDSGRAGHSISGIVLHTMVGTIGSAQSRFFNGNAQVSANYGIGLDGSIRRWVREADTAWCNGNYQSNLTTISIEHEDNGDYNGPRSPQLYEASAELVADICRRYNIPCDRTHIKGHNEVIDKSRYPGGTACPDGLAIDQIVANASAKLQDHSQAVSQPAPSATGETVFLPGDNTSWRLYPTDKLPVVGNEKAKLAPNQFNNGPNGAAGLVYPVLGHPYSNVVTIQTQMFGIGNIWVGPDTNAQINAAPVPPPIAPVITPAAENKQPTKAISKYERFPTPLQLSAKSQPTNVYNLDGGSWSVLSHAIVKQLTAGEEFTAVGKAVHPLGGVYFMTAFSFGDADKTGTPTHNQGVNTVDLKPVEVPEPPASPPPITINDNSGLTPEVVAPAETVPVTVIPANPEAWKATFKTNLAGEYIAQASLVVHDLENPSAEPHQLIRGQTYHVGGTFAKDGVEYYRTKTSVKNNSWIGIPTIALKESSLDADGDLFDQIAIDNAKHELQVAVGKVPLRAKAIQAFAEAEARHFHLPHFGKKKK